jgi:hypothetical protein
MRTRTRGIHVAAFAVTLLGSGAPAADEPPTSAVGPGPHQPTESVISLEISPAPPRAMHKLSSAGWVLMGVSAESERAVTSSGEGWGVTGGLWSFVVSNVEWRSSEVGLAAALGGGAGGLRGQLDARLLFGWRGYVTDWQGPFVRVGGELQTFGSFLTWVSAPAGVVGYELIDPRGALEVGLHSAFAASASYAVYRGSSRDVSDSLVFGAHAWMIAGPVQGGFRWDRLWPHDHAPLGRDPVDDLRSSACVAMGRFALLVCANLDIVSGPAVVPRGPALFETAGISQSISVGVGAVTSRAEAPYQAHPGFRRAP